MKEKLFDLTGKVALVTGASKGIGKAIAELYAQAGAQVVVSSRKQDAVDAVVADIKAKGGNALAIACNVSDAAEIQKLIDSTLSAYGTIDILVNNAAANPSFGPVVDTTESSFDKIIAVNVKGPFELAKKVYPIMKEKKEWLCDKHKFRGWLEARARSRHLQHEQSSAHFAYQSNGERMGR
jgi:NAD(P)-dependent dehydrogenase (short-subunit alcohol dehydrogenase family)